MVDIQSTTAAVLSVSSAATTAPALTPVQVVITNVTQALADLTRSIQTNATPVALGENGVISLATSLGSISVTLGQNLGVVEKQNLTQQILNLIQTQKPLTLTIQPSASGSPPTQGVLLVPTPPAATPSQTINAQPPTPTSSARVIAAGNEFSAIVLTGGATPPVSISQSPVPTISPLTISQIINAAPASPPSTQTQPLAPQTAPANTTALPSAQTVAQPLISAPVVPPLIPSLTASLQITTQNTQPALTPVLTPVQSPPLTPSINNLTSVVSTPIQTTNAQINFVQPSVSPTSLPPSAPPPVPQISVQSVATPNGVPVVSLLQTGNEVSVRVIAVVPSSQNIAAIPLAPNQIVATVTATGTNGNLVLKAGDATLFVNAPVSAPVGTELIIAVDPAKTVPPLVIRPVEQNNFSALPQALAELTQVAPQLAAQILATHIPQPTEALPGALLFLFSAFKQGNVKEWLGDNAVETLSRFGKHNIINSLSRNLSEAGQAVQDPVVGEWKSYPIPLFAQQQFQALNLYVHSDRDARRDDTPASNKPSAVRFLIDMRLSKLGNMQVDGFVQSKKLDMVLRSENNLPDGLHNELRAAYVRAVGAVGYAGTLTFQVGRRHWMMMQQAAVQGIVT